MQLKYSVLQYVHSELLQVVFSRLAAGDLCFSTDQLKLLDHVAKLAQHHD